METTRKLIGLREPAALNEAEDQLIAKMLQDVQFTIAEAMHIPWTASVEQELRKVFGGGMDLFRLFHRQHATFNVLMARAYDDDEPLRINPVTMGDVDNAEDDDALMDRLIEISVFPLVYKTEIDQGDMVRSLCRCG